MISMHTKIKICGLSRPEDIEAANLLHPDYIGFVFAKGSKREVSREKALELKKLLDPKIKAVGVFVREDPEIIAGLLSDGVIDIPQLHGGEDEAYIHRLRKLTDKPIIKAFRIDTEEDVQAAETSSADLVLLDSGTGGTGTTFDWSLIGRICRPYFLAGGLNPENAAEAVGSLKPFAVDVSSGVETDGKKDPQKMQDFVQAVRAVTDKK